jgi:hypothetical protein
MAKRRSTGDGGLHWDRRRRRWIATASLGFSPDGRRIVKTGSGRTRTEAKAKLQSVLRDKQDGLAIAPDGCTVREAVEDWLRYGLSGRDSSTIKACTHLCRSHVVPALGARKLRDLSADEVDRWLANKAQTLSTRTLQGLHSCLSRSIKRAMARDKVKRNVVQLCSVPQGRGGRPSKSLTLAQAEAVLRASQNSRMHAYIVVSLLTGARTEELRALRWDEVQLDAQPTTPLISRCGAQSARVATPRLGSRGGRLRYRNAASTRFLPRGSCRDTIARGPVTGGRNMVWCSPRRSEHHSTHPTCGATCDRRSAASTA